MTLTNRTAAVIATALLVAGCSSAKPAASSAPPASASSSATVSGSQSASASSTSPSASVSTSPPTAAAGGDLASMKGPDVMKLVAKAVRAAGSGRATGVLATGISGATGPVTLVFNGTTSQITLSYKGSTIDLISAPSGTYIKAPLALWTSQKVPAALAKKFAGHWVIAPSAGAGATTMTADGLAKEFENPTDGKVVDAVTKGTFAGKQVVVVKQSTGSFVDIATDGSNLPVYMQNAGAPGGKLTFSDFGKAVTITVPTNAIDLSTVVPGK